MSPHLLQRLYNQIKRVISQPIALADRSGQIYQDYSDFPRRTRLNYLHPISPQRQLVPIEDSPELQAIAIYQENRPFIVLVVEVRPEDRTTIEVITSLSELIIQQFIAEHQPRPDTVDLLLTRMAYRPSTIDREELENQITALGYRLDTQRTAIAVELSGFWNNYLHSAGEGLGEKNNLIAAKKSDLNQSLASFFTKSQDNLIGYIGNDTFLILKDLHNNDYDRFCGLLDSHYAQITDRLKNVHIKQVTIGVGLPSSSLNGLLRSVQEALQVLLIGKRVIGEGRTHRYQSLGMLPLLLSGESDQKLGFANRLLGVLEGDPELIQTLEAFLGCDLNLTKTSEELKIHRNTVIYRLNKIQEVLNKDPRRFVGAVELYLALLFRKYFAQ